MVEMMSMRDKCYLYLQHLWNVNSTINIGVETVSGSDHFSSNQTACKVTLVTIYAAITEPAARNFRIKTSTRPACKWEEIWNPLGSLKGKVVFFM